MLFFWTLYSSKILKKMYDSIHTNISSTTVIIIINIYCASNQYIIMISDFHVTVKTGRIAAEM